MHPKSIHILLPSTTAYDLAEGLEAPVQLLYLGLLLSFLAVGAYLVVRQVLIRRELEEAAKVLGERVRNGEAVAEDYFELGVILLRKKLYTQATRNLEKAKKAWDGEPEELAQVLCFGGGDAALCRCNMGIMGFVCCWHANPLSINP